MSYNIPSILLQLWGLAGGNPIDAASDWNTTFDPIGLILLAPLRNYGYWCTPVNSLTFAVTGGDGVHFGILATNGGYTEFSPVVMTVPMCDTPNTIVGANLREFLALGCKFGYFALEQLIYTREEALRELELARFDPEGNEKERVLLRTLASAFKLSPWVNPAHRLAELAKMFVSTIELPPSTENA